jgi:ABC-type nitrate/sulfonate/bicarbonate transport system substrate-binding protein
MRPRRRADGLRGQSRLASPAAAILLLAAAACGPSTAARGAAAPAAPAPSGAAPAAAPAAPAAGAPAAPPAPLHVVANWTQPTGAMSGFWIAQEAGINREQGLDVELLNIANTSRVLQTMAAGEMDLSPLDPGTVIRASLGGLDGVLLYAQTNRLTFGVYAQPSIQDPQELRGKVLGTTRIGASANTALTVALKRWGLMPDRDVALRQLGETQAIYAAMQAGQIDGAPFGLPVDRALLPNQRELINLATDGPEYASIAAGGPRAWINDNEEAVRRFGRAYVLAIQRFKNDKAYTLDLYRKYLGKDGPEYLDAVYALFSRTLPTLPYVTDEAMASALADLVEEEPQLAGHQGSEWVDSRFVREIEQSGLVAGSR